MREIVFDTETTGLSPQGGDRIVEIGCVEMFNHIPTGNSFHVYINPQRDIPDAAFQVHGLSSQFLADKPVFAAIAEEFLGFVGDARLVAHNASFDIAFINAEFERLGHAPVGMDRVVDTLVIARRKHPFGPNSLDALCQRYGVDNSRRTKHGALMDAEILAEVYLELLGGRQADLGLVAAGGADVESRAGGGAALPLERPAPLPPRLDPVQVDAHLAFVSTLGTSAVWLDYVTIVEQAKAG